jgi:hypothetical protein
MMNANNTYFENLKKIGHDWEAKRAERQARKQPIIDTYGWDSEELKAWYAEDAAAKFPFEQGTCKAYRAWKNSIIPAIILPAPLHDPVSSRLQKYRLHARKTIYPVVLYSSEAPPGPSPGLYET